VGSLEASRRVREDCVRLLPLHMEEIRWYVEEFLEDASAYVRANRVRRTIHDREWGTPNRLFAFTKTFALQR
jgi:hypothetical protein